MLENNEIIKALECCKTGDCDNCPFYGRKEDCEVELPEEALNLINRQQEEIERLQKANGLLKYLKEAVHRVEIGGKEEIVDYVSEEAFQNAITKRINLMCNVQTVKAEAIKDFEDKAIKRICERVVAPTPTQSYIVERCNEEIHDLAKEMTQAELDAAYKRLKDLKKRM